MSYLCNLVIICHIIFNKVSIVDVANSIMHETNYHNEKKLYEDNFAR